MRVLLSAFYFSPYRGSEAGVGWRTAVELAKYCEVTVLCGDVVRGGPTGTDLKKYQEGNPTDENLLIEYISPSRLTIFVDSLHSIPGLWFLYYLAYNLWQRTAFKRARTLHAAQHFDVVHHVNVIGFREPGYLWMLGIPFFWGPIAGASMIPWDYIRPMGLKAKFRWGGRNVLNWFQIRFNRRCRRVARIAKQVWAVTPEDLAMVTNIWGCNAESMLETGGVPATGRKNKSRSRDMPLQIVWSGLFQPIKALPLLLEALAGLPDRLQALWSLDVLGDGEERENWRNLADSLAISDRITWHGMLPQSDAIHIVGRAHVLAHTSVKEATSSVIFEALSNGVPILCHDACGMGTAVTPACGRKVPLIDRRQSITGFRAGIEELINNPDTISKLSCGAITRSHELSWENKVRKIWKTYQMVL